MGWAIQYTRACEGQAGPALQPPSDAPLESADTDDDARLPALDAVPEGRRALVSRDPDLRSFFCALGDRPMGVPRAQEIEKTLGRWGPAFLRRLKAVCVLSYGRLVWEWPLQLVRRLLEDTEWGEKRICLHTDFSSLETMCRAFRHRFGMTPTAWRARHLAHLAAGRPPPPPPPFEPTARRKR